VQDCVHHHGVAAAGFRDEGHSGGTAPTHNAFHERFLAGQNRHSKPSRESAKSERRLRTCRYSEKRDATHHFLLYRSKQLLNVDDEIFDILRDLIHNILKNKT